MIRPHRVGITEHQESAAVRPPPPRALPARPPAAPEGRGSPRPRPLPLFSQSHQCVGTALGLRSQSAPRVTQSGAVCTRFKGREKLAAPEPSQSGGRRGRLSLLPNGKPGRCCGAGRGRLAGASTSKRAELAASPGSPDQWARAVGGARVSVPRLWIGSRAGAGLGRQRVQRCTKMHSDAAAVSE